MFPEIPRAEEIYFLITLSLIPFRRGCKGPVRILLSLGVSCSPGLGWPTFWWDPVCFSEAISFLNTSIPVCYLCKCTEDISPTFSSAALSFEPLQRDLKCIRILFKPIYYCQSLGLWRKFGEFVSHRELSLGSTGEEVEMFSGTALWLNKWKDGVFCDGPCTLDVIAIDTLPHMPPNFHLGWAFGQTLECVPNPHLPPPRGAFPWSNA